VVQLNRDWLAAHPLPRLDAATDKNHRGRVLLAGGAHFVPGALRLTGEAVLRVGAGKLQMATVQAAAFHLGVAVPEAAVIALPASEDGEIDASAAPKILEATEHADAFVLGPGMSGCPNELVALLVAQPREELTLVLDAAAIGCCSGLAMALKDHEGRAILTPHHGEMAALTGREIDEIGAEPERAARDAAETFGAVVALKGDRTFVAAPDGQVLMFDGGVPGLATGGSGDVLAGITGGLAARGVAPLAAAAWAVWLHGHAGRVLAERIGETGFLARELLLEIPRLMSAAAR
jgi:ADP-dependent NAD(P)H-hydrate dehydratase